MRPIVVTVGPLASANAALLAASQTPTSGTALTLTGSQPDLPRRVLLTFGNEASNRTMVLTGTNWSGQTISETLTIASGAGGTVSSVLDYKTVTSALPLGGGWTAAVTLGTVGTGGAAASPWVRMDDYGFAAVSINVDVSGTANYTVQSSDDDPNLLPPFPVVALNAMVWINHPNLASQTTSQHDGYTYVPRWIRVLLNSGSGTVALSATQMGGHLG